jgi:hypothetical protein
MDAQKIIETLKRIPVEAQSAYIQTQVNDWDDLAVDILDHIISRLNFLVDSTLDEYKELRRFIELIITHLPEDFTKKPESIRKALAKPISTTLFFADYPQKFVSIRKLIALDLRDPRPTCKLLCRPLDQGIEIKEWEYEQLLPFFRNLVINNVDDVIKFIDDIRQNYQNNSTVEEFLVKLETDLKIVDLKIVKGPSLRKRFARELIGSNVIDSKKSILIVGESGTSKTFLAHRVAKNSRYGNLMLVNSANPKADLEKALAAAMREPTTFLLDEVYAMPNDMQEYCLAEFGRAGIQMRIISTSSTPVDELQRKLKRDFFYRINDWTFRLRPLAENRPDVEEAIRGLVEEKYRMGIDARVVTHLRDSHTWPDNFRGVEKVMETLCRMCKARGVDIISVEILAELKPEIDEDILKILKPLID